MIQKLPAWEDQQVMFLDRSFWVNVFEAFCLSPTKIQHCPGCDLPLPGFQMPAERYLWLISVSVSIGISSDMILIGEVLFYILLWMISLKDSNALACFNISHNPGTLADLFCALEEILKPLGRNAQQKAAAGLWVE